MKNLAIIVVASVLAGFGVAYLTVGIAASPEPTLGRVGSGVHLIDDSQGLSGERKILILIER